MSPDTPTTQGLYQIVYNSKNSKQFNIMEDMEDKQTHFNDYARVQAIGINLRP